MQAANLLLQYQHILFQPMLNTLTSRITSEYHHFLLLSQAARKLLLSFSFYELVIPLIFSFINAFLFRQTASFTSVVIYNLGLFISIAVFFYVNGLLIKFISLKWLYVAGLVGQGLVLNALFFLPIDSWVGLFGFGLLQGVFVGLYWANRNFMSIEITTDSNRTYFVGLEQIFAIGSELLAPLVIGGVISLGALYGWYQVDVAYQGLGIFSLLILIVGAVAVRSVIVENPVIPFLLIRKPSAQWWYVRLAEIIYGSFQGSYLFITPLLVFVLIGEEGMLGLLQSGAALITLLLMYYFSRKLQPTQRVKLITITMMVLFAISVMLALFFNTIAGITLVILASPINHLRWIAWSPTVMSAIDAQDGDASSNYAYVADRELFMNIGRMVGIAFFIGLISWSSDASAIRFSPLLIALLQLGFAWAVQQVLARQDKILR